MLALLLMLVYGLSATACREWLKIPALFSHYSVYSSTTGKGIPAFLHDHYLHENDQGKDDLEDTSLPFHTADYAGQSQFTSLAPDSEPEWIVCMHAQGSIHDPLFYDEMIPAGYQACIWQPPRFS